MRTPSLLTILGAVWLVSGCGARSSEDELLWYQGGSSASGGSHSSGGSGGFVANSGGATYYSTGGSFPAGGGFIGTGGFIGSGGAAVGGGGGYMVNSCCESHDIPGCAVRFVEECTCGIDPFCCEEEWDARCVQTAENACLAACTTPSSGGSPATGGQPSSGGGAAGGSASGGAGSGGGDCCTAHGTTQCSDPEVTNCVCDTDAFCCTTAWDSYCVQGAELCGAGCGMTSSGGSGSGGSAGAGGQSPLCDFAGDCASCMCDNCETQLAGCQSDVGCLAIAWCVQSTGCLPLECYDQGFCRDTIDSFGGLLGASASSALKLSSCVLSSSCPCQ